MIEAFNFWLKISEEIQEGRDTGDHTDAAQCKSRVSHVT